MKKKADKVDPWNRSELVPKSEEMGVFLWSDLSAEQREAFKNSFCSEKAIKARVSVMKPLRKDSHDMHVASLLRLYRESMLNNYEDAPHLAEMVQLHLLAHLSLGGWEHLEWLVQYGKTRYPQGLLGADTTITEIDPLHHLDETSWTVLATMLRVFSRLSGIPLMSCIVPVTIVDEASSLSPPLNLGSALRMNAAGVPPSNPTVLPKGLPTKAFLDSETLKEWHKYTYENPKEKAKREMGETESARQQLSRDRKRLGLEALPKIKQRRRFLTSKQLSEAGENLRDSLRG